MNVGDYVRDITGKIGIIKQKQYEERYSKDVYLVRRTRCFKGYFVKSGLNIIDIIEVGDYVNGSRVIEICNEDKDIFNKYLVVDEVDYDGNNISYSNNDIKSIVTKELFESVKYRIGK